MASTPGDDDRDDADDETVTPGDPDAPGNWIDSDAPDPPEPNEPG